LRVWVLLVTVGVSTLGCDPKETAPQGGPSPIHPGDISAGGPGASSDGSGSAAASADAAPANALAGTWKGDYDAKKGSVELDPKVKDKTWKEDDGKKAAGSGTVSLTVLPDGTIEGKGQGALGNFSLAGQVDEQMIRATVLPDEPTHPLAMTGVLVGKVEDEVIRGRIRVAGPDATVVREAPIELRRGGD
jgi:hypothetical protein